MNKPTGLNFMEFPGIDGDKKGRGKPRNTVATKIEMRFFPLLITRKIKGTVNRLPKLALVNQS